MDRARDGVLVVFNANTSAVTQRVDGLAGHALTLSKAQAQGSDPVVKTTRWDTASGTVTVPARTVVVLEQKQHGSPWHGPWTSPWAGSWTGPWTGPWFWSSWPWSWLRG